MSDEFRREVRGIDDRNETETAPIDFALLDRIRLRLRDSERFESVDWRPEYAPRSVVFHYDLGYFPSIVEDAYLKVCWRENDDFLVHYEEKYDDGRRWACRWDRHPNDHNARDHYHPPPDADEPCEDDSYSDDWRDVLAFVLREIDDHVKAFWDA